MCLSTTKINLIYDRQENDYIGYGYKAYPKEIFENAIITDKTIHRGVKLSNKEWMEAKGRSDLNIDLIMNDYEELYHPGFHILLTADIARHYAQGYRNDFPFGYVIAKVKYKNVLSFGTNYISSHYDRKSYYADCVVSKYLKIQEIIYVS